MKHTTRRTLATVAGVTAITATLGTVPAHADDYVNPDHKYYVVSKTNPYISQGGTAMYKVISINGSGYSQLGRCPQGTKENDWYAPNDGLYQVNDPRGGIYDVSADTARKDAVSDTYLDPDNSGGMVSYEYQNGPVQRTTPTAVVVGDCVPTGYHESDTSSTDGYVQVLPGDGPTTLLTPVGSTVKKDGDTTVEVVSHPSAPTPKPAPTKVYNTITSFTARYISFHIPTAAARDAYNKIVANPTYAASLAYDVKTGKVSLGGLTGDVVQTLPATLYATYRQGSDASTILAAQKAQAAKDLEITTTVHKAIVGHDVAMAFIIPDGGWDITMSWSTARTLKSPIVVGNMIW